MNDRGLRAGFDAKRTLKVWVIVVATLLILPHVPGLNANFGRSMLSQMGIAIMFALSYSLLLGQTGLLSFGHAAYFGLGGYAAIHLMRAINHGLAVPMPLVPLAGAAAGLIFGILFGSVITRRAGVVFALISLGVGELVFAIARMLQSLSGGEEGLTANRGHGPHVFGLDFSSQLQIYYVIAFWLAVAAAGMYAFVRTPAGRMCNAVRDNPERAEFIGYSAARVRFIALSVSAMFAGLAGGLHALNYEIVGVEALGAARSGAVLLMVYIGGVSSFAGAIIGAIVITWLQISLSDYTQAWQLYLGLFFIAVVLFAPGGIAGVIKLHAPILRTRAFAGVIKVYAIALLPFAVMLLGTGVLLETSYRLSTQAESGSKLSLFHVAIDAATPWPWLAELAMVIGGFVVFRKTWPLVTAAWERARAEAAASPLSRA